MMMSLRSKWAVGKAVRAGLALEGAYLNRYVTDEQRSRRPIFNATLRAAAGWLFFRVAGSTRMNPFDALSLAHGKPSDANAADTRDTGHVRNRIECPEQATARRMGQIWALYRQSGSDRLEKQPTDLRRHHHYM